VDPYRSSVRHYRRRLPEFRHSDSFIKLTYDTTGHSSTFVTSPDRNRDLINGYALPLGENPNGWLVFAKFAKGGNAVERALILSIDKENIKVKDVDGIPTINAQVFIDGERYDLYIPELVGSWKKATEKNRSKATKFERTREGKLLAFIPVTSKELVTGIKNGYYYNDILNYALGAFYEEAWVNN
ncbi:MAG: hypothetical protein PHW73_15190, partial [Atribacterota bacterium]|nr:hypothetical protein [Atribacterota bacterium]